MTERKNENFNDLTMPKFFYCTFHTEYALHKAVEVNTFELLGEDTKIVQATEPTDIIWENRHIRKSERNIRWFFVALTMALLTMIVFTIIVWLLKKKILYEYMQNPPAVNCNSVIYNFNAD